MQLNDFNSEQWIKSPEGFNPSTSDLKKLNDPTFLSSIPLLNYTPLHLLKDMELVRFRGMVQDMQDPEFYIERCEVRNKNDNTRRIQNGKYSDCLALNPEEEIIYNSANNVQSERRTLFVVSIPGINNWTVEYEKQINDLNVPHINLASTSTENHVKKRSAPNDSMDVDDVETNVTDSISNNCATQNEAKRQCKEQAATKKETTCSLSADFLINSPIPERPSKACMVKIYKGFDDYALNEAIEVIGFLSVNPELNGSNIDAENDEKELLAQNPPPSLIPRLHAIAVKILPHHNPLLDERFLSQTPAADAEHFNMLSVQKDLRILFSLFFFNDELAAEYMLCHLISTVYSRAEFQCFGKFCLNVCNLPQELPTNYTKKLYEILELMIPASHYLKMTLDNLNTYTFAPGKDYETNKLISGLTQLAPHTHLVLDETYMAQGKLGHSGIMALQSLANLINQQQMKCDFEYYDIDYDVDIPVLVLSEGKSMLPSDFILPLQCETQTIELMEETLKAARHYLQPERLDRFRRYLTKAKLTNFTMNECDKEIVQQDFVEMRRNGEANSAEELHLLLVLTRLLGIARGKTVFDKETWDLAKQLENKRRQRVRMLPKSNRILEH